MSAKRTTPLRVAVLASGRGSNLQALIDGIEAGQVQASIVAVISNKKDAVALERARKHGIRDLFVDPKPFAGQPDSREAYDGALLAMLQQHDVELVLLAGYMKIVTSVLVNAYANRMMNIHPSLLPSFPGLEAWKQALAEGKPIVFGCLLFDSFDDCNKWGGVVPMPAPAVLDICAARPGHDWATQSAVAGTASASSR